MLQQKIVTHLVLLQLIISSQYLVMSEETTVTCVAPSVKEGQPGQLTCNFNLDLSELDDYIATVEFYPAGQKYPIQIIECHVAKGSKGCSGVKEGYTFDETIDSHLRLDMTNVSTSNVGSYVCKLSSTEIRADLVPCSFNIDGAPPDPTTTTTATTQGKNLTEIQATELEGEFPFLPVAVGAVALGLLLVIVFVTTIFCKRRRQHSRSADDAEIQKLTDPSISNSKPAVVTTGQSVSPSEDDDPPPIPIRYDKVYDDQRRGEDGDKHFINAMGVPATDAEPPPKPPRSYERLSQETHEDDAKVMSAPEKEETDVAK